MSLARMLSELKLGNGFKQKNRNGLKILDIGDTVPTDATAGYEIGALFLHTDGSAGTVMYSNEGTANSCDFNAVSALTAAQEALLSATAGTATASKAVILDASKNITGLANVGIDNLIPTENIGAKAGATVTGVEYGDGIWHRTTLTLTATPVTLTDDANNGQWGAVKIYDFPAGVIMFAGGTITGALTAGVTGTFIDNWNGDIGVGTSAATDSTAVIDTAQANIIPSTTLNAGAADKIGVVEAPNNGAAFPTQVTESNAVWLDGTASALDAYLNVDIDDDGTHTSGTGTFTGVVSFVWCYLGDH